ncbi:MAG: DNA polymerase III subunit delta [Chloroflexi bacterium]|nr:DNA polymerase III subunit delta [Chloroflexota bacterium]
MIYVLYGEDDFTRKTVLDGLRREVGAPELLDANSTVLAGTALTLAQLQEVANVIPFLAERRLVIVEGLLGRFDDSRPRQRRRSGRGGGSSKSALDGWEGLGDALQQIPSTTNLVFLDGQLRRDNPLLVQIAPVAEVRHFPPLAGADLDQWVRRRVDQAGISIAPDAVRRLIELVGGDLWILSGELEKLALYAGQDTVDRDMVDLLVTQAREASIFRAVDAILDGHTSGAMQLIADLRQHGQEVSYIITMLARQLRLLLLAQELRSERLSTSDLAKRLGLTAEFAARRTQEQAARYRPMQIAIMYRRLLETDLAIKQGTVAEEQALETLVAELCAIARPTSPHPNRNS